MKYSQALAIMALVSTTSAIKIAKNINSIEHAGAPPTTTLITSDAFADAAVQARIDADNDISQEIKHHHTIESQAHNKSWKKHFKESDFYKQYSKHTEEEIRCKDGCNDK